MKRRPPISFRSDAILHEVQQRCAPGHESLQAKQDLLDHYSMLDEIMRAYPQKMVGASYVYRHWLDHGTTIDRVGPVPGYAYDRACAKMREMIAQRESFEAAARTHFRIV